MPTPIQTFTPIASVVLGSNAASLSIASIPQTHDHLVITGGFTRNINGNFGGRGAEFQWNGVTSGYKSTGAGIGGGSSSGGGSGYNTGASGPVMSAGNIYYQGGRGAGEIWIPNYSLTGFQKHALQMTWQADAEENGGGYCSISDTLIPITGPLTSLYIYEQVDTFVTGDWVTLYGVKNA
jgi:hypothetical protein